eukprot:TRINITY_DN1073_c0_g1_i1.p2 TRINITY_DN1073_c0_g1~~TRINITY_DN1073_c0_g1_i1.p2  ORF type:complete len:229 (-),score=75.85 TRINITY_DN1073_c0_g1_i1:395-1081(-)
MSSRFVLRVLLIGDQAVGKTSVVARYLDDTFTDSLIDDSIGVAYRETPQDRDGYSYTLQVWDAGSSQSVRHVTPSYYRNANAVFIMYDVTVQASFDNVKSWIQDIDRYAPEEIEVYIVGNKMDDAARVVDFDTASEFARDQGLPLMEVSAKTGEGVSEAFDGIISKALAKRRMVMDQASVGGSSGAGGCRPAAVQNVPRALCKHCGRAYADHTRSPHKYEPQKECTLL